MIGKSVWKSTNKLFPRIASLLNLQKSASSVDHRTLALFSSILRRPSVFRLKRTLSTSLSKSPRTDAKKFPDHRATACNDQLKPATRRQLWQLTSSSESAEGVRAKSDRELSESACEHSRSCLSRWRTVYPKSTICAWPQVSVIIDLLYVLPYRWPALYSISCRSPPFIYTISQLQDKLVILQLASAPNQQVLFMPEMWDRRSNIYHSHQ